MYEILVRMDVAVVRPVSACAGGSCTLALVLPAGFQRERGAAEKGLAHLVEHAVFRNVTSPGGAAQAAFDIGGEMNAYTTGDHVLYHISLPVARLRAGVRLLLDTVFSKRYDAAGVAAERKIIAEEYLVHKQDPEFMLCAEAEARCFPKGDRRVRDGLASAADMRHQTDRHVAAFTARCYRADAAHLVLCTSASVTAARLRGYVTECGMRVGEGSPPPPPPPPPRPLRAGHAVKQRGDSLQSGVAVAVPLARPAGPQGAAARLRLRLVAFILGGPSGLLFKAVREKHKLAYGADCSLETVDGATVVLIAHCFVTPANAARAAAVLHGVLDAFELDAAGFDVYKLNFSRELVERDAEATAVSAAVSRLRGDRSTPRETARLLAKSVGYEDVCAAARAALSVHRATVTRTGRA